MRRNFFSCEIMSTGAGALVFVGSCRERHSAGAKRPPYFERPGAYLVSEGFFWKVFESKMAKNVIFINRVFQWLHRL